MKQRSEMLKLKKKFLHAFCAARYRCNVPISQSYHHYGGRGIKFLWKSYEEFGKDMYEKFVDAYFEHGIHISLDRINNDGNYCKENCRWTTQSEQGKNRRTPVLKPRPLSFIREKCLQNNIPITTYYARRSHGWSKEKSFSVPIKKSFLELNGKKQRLSDWSKEIGISQQVIKMRIKYGWPLERVLTTPLTR